MKHWLKENWFKLSIVLLLATLVITFAIDRYETRKPKTLEEKIQRRVLDYGK